jgi:hypothetical protein
LTAGGREIGFLGGTTVELIRRKRSQERLRRAAVLTRRLPQGFASLTPFLHWTAGGGMQHHDQRILELAE